MRLPALNRAGAYRGGLHVQSVVEESHDGAGTGPRYMGTGLVSWIVRPGGCVSRAFENVHVQVFIRCLESRIPIPGWLHARQGQILGAKTAE